MDSVKPAFLLSLAAVVVILFFTFTHNEHCLAAGLDGTWYRVMLGYETIDRPAFAQTGVDALSGSFDAYYPLQREYMLPSALSLLLTGKLPGVGITYFLGSVFLFGAIYVLGRSVQIERAVAITGAFLMVVLAPPGLVNRPSQLYHLFQLNPHWFQTTALACIIVAAFWALDGKGLWRTAALVLMPMICLGIAILGVAPQVIFMVPPVAVYGGASLLAARHWRDDRWRLAAGVLMIGVPLILGAGTYYFSLINYTAYLFFPAEIAHPLAGKAGLSSLFSYWPLARWTIVLGILGAAWIALVGAGKLRLLAMAHLVATALFFAFGSWFAFFAADYRGSFPIYFETGLWPYATLFTAALITSGARVALVVLTGLFGGKNEWSRRSVSALVLAAALLVVGAYNAAAAWRGNKDCSGWTTPVVRSTAITDYLEKAIALEPGLPFRGLVATFAGFQKGKPADWIDIAGHDHQMWEETGNDHRVAGLWQFNIPTLFQYHTFITPPYYLVTTDFLASRGDHQLRSSIVISKIDLPALRLWGVRYIITDDEPTVGREVARLPTKDLGTLYLSELTDPNLGDYSPTKVEVANDFRDGLRMMHAPEFDGRDTVVTNAPLEGSFVPATAASFVYETDGLHVKAESAGRSLLVLPAQYSHCWTVEGEGGASLFRADLALLGVGFTGHLDAKLIFRFGPVLAGGCRLEDLRDMTRLRVAEGRGASSLQAKAP